MGKSEFAQRTRTYTKSAGGDCQVIQVGRGRIPRSIDCLSECENHRTATDTILGKLTPKVPLLTSRLLTKRAPLSFDNPN